MEYATIKCCAIEYAKPVDVVKVLSLPITKVDKSIESVLVPLYNIVNPEVPEVPLVPSTPEVPLVPSTPEVPLVPSTPEVPLVPDVPVVPEVPFTPDVPELPDTAPTDVVTNE